MGINYESYHKASENKEVHQAIERTRKLFGEHKLILSVDRLDYSKGILHRLRALPPSSNIMLNITVKLHWQWSLSLHATM